MGATGCRNAAGDGHGDDVGHLRAQLTLADVSHGVTSIQVRVVAAGQACDAAAVAQASAMRSAAALPGSAQPAGGGALHPSFDAFFTLAPGAYHVCATTLAGGIASAACATAQGDTMVMAEATS